MMNDDDDDDGDGGGDGGGGDTSALHCYNTFFIQRYSGGLNRNLWALQHPLHHYRNVTDQ